MRLERSLLEIGRQSCIVLFYESQRPDYIETWTSPAANGGEFCRTRFNFEFM